MRIIINKAEDINKMRVDTKGIKDDIIHLNKVDRFNGNPIISGQNADIFKKDIIELANSIKKDYEFFYNQLLEIADKICSIWIVNNCYTGRCVVKSYFIGALETIIGFIDSDMGKKADSGDDITIFLSYCWADKEIANKIDTSLTNCDLKIIRDIRDIENWKSIREFMQSIRNQDYAIFIISDNYLRSTNCMFEVYEMLKEQQYQDRIFPVILEHKIYNPTEKINYIRYWERECSKLEAGIRSIDPANSSELTLELRHMRQISQSIGEFMKIVSDMNNPSEADINCAIKNKLAEKGILKKRV